MDSKRRAELRGLANTLKPLFQLGKQGINENFIEVAAQITAERTSAEVVSVMGGVVTLFRYSEELHLKQKEKAENIRKAQNLKRKKAYDELKEKQEKYRKSRREYQKREAERKTANKK